MSCNRLPEGRTPTRTALAGALVVLALAACTSSVPPGPDPPAEVTGAPISAGCSVLFDERRSPVAGIRVTLPYVVAGTSTSPGSAAATAEIDALLGVVAEHGAPELQPAVEELRRLHSTAQRGAAVTPSQVDHVVAHLDSLCDPEVVQAAGWAGWPN